MKKFNLLLVAFVTVISLRAQDVSTFENLTLATDTFYDGSDLSGGFTSGNAHFNNVYNTSFQSWDGFAYTNKKDTVTAGYTNSYSAITGGGYRGSSNYAVGLDYGNARLALTGNAAGHQVSGFFVTNTTYDYLSMKNGDQFAKKFGGATGNDADWFKLTVKGWTGGNVTSNAVDFYLADFRSADSTQDYIVKNWKWVDLRSLGNVDSLSFTLSSSDTGSFGMNTPAYFALDNFITGNNLAPVAGGAVSISINYNQDTTINVIAHVTDTTATPLVVNIIVGTSVAGTSVTVDSANNIVYSPAIGIVADDTIMYTICDQENKCDTGVLAINVVGLTGVNEVANQQMAVYPNPFSGQLTIQHSTDVKEIRMYDIAGRNVVAVICDGADRSTINTNNLAGGTYFVKLVSDKGIAVAKVVRQ